MFWHLYQKENRTISKLLKYGCKVLKEYSIEEPLKNSEILLSEALGKKNSELYINQQQVSIPQARKFIKYLKKRIHRIPYQYIIKKVEFFKYEFFIEKGVFIPRPETEILVEKTIEIYKKFFASSVDILDIGTGCGNIAISLALEIEQSNIVATDISNKSLKIAKKNAYRYKLGEKIKFLKKDLFPANMKFDLIITNPPYIPDNEISQLPEEVKKEPLIALRGGKDGIETIRRILRESRNFLKDKGFLIMEIGDGQLPYIEKEVPDFLKIFEVVCDYSKIERVIIFRKIES